MSGCNFSFTFRLRTMTRISESRTSLSLKDMRHNLIWSEQQSQATIGTMHIGNQPACSESQSSHESQALQFADVRDLRKLV